MYSLYKRFTHLLKKRVSLLLIAFMLGMSNVILEETRMVNDNRINTEQQEVLPNEDSIDFFNLFDAQVLAESPTLIP